MAAISIALSLLSVLTIWLVIPIFILPPLAFYFGLKAHRRFQANNPTPTSLAEFLSLAPIFLSVAAFLFGVYLITTGYRV